MKNIQAKNLIFLIATGFSVFGTNASYFAIAWIFAKNQNFSPLFFGLILVSERILGIVFYNTIGRIIDRYNKVKLSIFINIIAGTMCFLLPRLLKLDIFFPFLIYVLIFGFFLSASQIVTKAFFPIISEGEELKLLNTIHGTLSQLAMLFAYGATGFLLLWTNYDIIFYIDGISFYIIALTTLILGYGKNSSRQVCDKKELSELFLLKDRVNIFVPVSMSGLIAGMLFTLEIRFLTLDLNVQPNKIGLLVIFAAITSIVFNNLLPKVMKSFFKIQTAFIFILVVFLSATLYPLSFNLITAIIFASIYSAFDNVFNVVLDYNLQNIYKNHAGSIFSLKNLYFNSFLCVGFLLGGLIATYLMSVRATIFTISFICFIIMSIILFKRKGAIVWYQ